MIPMPIFIPSHSLSGAEYIYPKWVETICCIGIGCAVIGIVWMIMALILSIITDKMEVLEKPHIYSVALAMFGLAVLLIGALLMLLTGQKITE